MPPWARAPSAWYLSRYSVCLWTGRSGDRIPVGARFFAHVQTGPAAHPASCTMGTGSFPGVKRPGRCTDHPPLLAPRSRRIELQLCPPSRPVRPPNENTFASTVLLVSFPLLIDDTQRDV